MADSAPRRRSAPLVPIAIGLVLLAGLWLLPDLTPRDLVPQIGQESHHARIVEDLGPDPAGLPSYAVEVVDGPAAGERLEAVVQAIGPGLPGADERDPYAVGDEVVVIRFTGAAGGGTVISEPWRLPLLALIGAAFAAVVLVIGGLRGARSLVALAFTLTVIVKVVVPLLLRGVDPVLLAVAGGSAVAVVSLLLTEGPSRVASAALLGTAGALGLTAGLAAVFTSLATFSALQGSEEIAFLVPLVGERIDLAGLLLAATVFGALGVLDDVTITQAAAVEQLHRANPAAGRRRVIGRAMLTSPPR
jgi:uncharacterized membrane protein